MTARSHDDIESDFFAIVNMPVGELERWLQTEQSRSVGQVHDGEHESVGHQSGQHIVTILRKRKDNLSAADYGHMVKVIGYVHRHLAQRPDDDLRDTRWRCLS